MKPAKQYTIRRVPETVDRALRRRAKTEGKSLNRTALEALQRGVGPGDGHELFTDLDHLIGRWEDEPGFEQALARQDRIEKKLWR